MDGIAVGNRDRSAGRTLTQVESELLEAEKAFVDAEARLEAAKSERSATLEKINRCQLEFDEIVAQRRRRSTPGTKWHRESPATEEALLLEPEDELIDENGSSGGKGFKVVSGQFDRLRDYVRDTEAGIG